MLTQTFQSSTCRRLAAAACSANTKTRAVALRALLALLVTAGASNIGAASPMQDRETAMENSVEKTEPGQLYRDVDGLMKHLRISVRPQEVIWTEVVHDNDWAPTDRRLEAVILFDDEGATQFVQELNAAPQQKRPRKFRQIETEPWYPEPLKVFASNGETSLGTKYQTSGLTKMPYTRGEFFQIDETNYFIVKLGT